MPGVERGDTRWCCDKDATSDSCINAVPDRKKSVESVNEVWMGEKQVGDPLDDARGVDSVNGVRESRPTQNYPRTFAS